MAVALQSTPAVATGEIEIVVTDADVDQFLACMDADLPMYARPPDGGRRRVPPELVAKLGMMATIQDFCIATFGQNLRAKQSFRFLAPIHVGMRVRGQGRLSGDYEKRGRRFVVFEAEYRDEDGRLLLLDQRTQCVIGQGLAAGDEP